MNHDYLKHNSRIGTLEVVLNGLGGKDFNDGDEYIPSIH